MSDVLHTAIADLEWDEALAAAQAALDSGRAPLLVVEECRRALEEVGARFEAGDYFLSELILGAEIFKEVMAMVAPSLAAAGGGEEPLGRVVIGTVHGDIHDLGKNVVVALLTANNFAVHDLGVDVAEEAFIEAVRAYRPRVLGMSALLTTSFEPMKRTIAALEREGLRPGLTILVGGGAVDERVREYVGADAVGRNAAHAVDLARAAMAVA